MYTAITNKRHPVIILVDVCSANTLPVQTAMQSMLENMHCDETAQRSFPQGGIAHKMHARLPQTLLEVNALALREKQQAGICLEVEITDIEASKISSMTKRRTQNTYPTTNITRMNQSRSLECGRRWVVDCR